MLVPVNGLFIIFIQLTVFLASITARLCKIVWMNDVWYCHFIVYILPRDSYKIFRLGGGGGYTIAQ